MEVLGVVICVMIVGGFVAGMVMLTMDEQVQFEERKKRKDKKN
jgi:hypothetical protein